MMKSFLKSALIAALGLTASQFATQQGHAADGGIPSGSYRCTATYGRMLTNIGKLEIAGSSYKFGTPDGKNMHSKGTYTVEKAGAKNLVTWNGPFKPFSEAPSRITETRYSQDKAGKVYIEVMHKPEPGSLTVQMTCQE